jgi:hypothetical protein
MTDQTQSTPPQVAVVDPEPLAPTDYTRSNRQGVELWMGVVGTLASLISLDEYFKKSSS